MSVKLRAHHILCMQFFEGKGYSEGFVRNMTQVLRTVQDCTITDGADVLCAACPNLQNGLCTTQEKVERYDKNVADFLGLQIGETYDFSDLSAKLHPTKEQLRTLCGDCEWQPICQKKI